MQFINEEFSRFCILCPPISCPTADAYQQKIYSSTFRTFGLVTCKFYPHVHNKLRNDVTTRHCKC